MTLFNSNLEGFMAVARHGTVHAGARVLHISQIALTQRIQSLEQKLKVTLFIRTRQGMKLTSEGIKLLRYCHVVADLNHDVLNEFLHPGINTSQHIQISGPSSIMSSRIIPIGMKIMKLLPRLYINFDVNDSDEIISKLRSGFTEFSILRPHKISNEMESKQLKPEKYLLVCTKKWKNRKLKDILSTERIIDFDEADQMTFTYLNAFNLFENIQSDRLFVNRTESLTQMLIAGCGYGVLTEEFSQSYLKSDALIALHQGKVFENELSLAWFKRPEMPSYFMAIIQALN